MLFYEDKTFTVATGTDQYIATSAINNNMNHEQAQHPVLQPITQGKPIRYLSVCSGMEAASVAWHPLGWKPVGFSEIEPFPCAILKHRFPDVPNYGDLTKYAEWPLAVGDVDLICGGTPCQAFSVAGLRQGLADPRGNLALVFLGLVDRLRPKYVLWENVPGVLSSNRGEDFAAFVGALAELGYGFAWRCVDAQFFGVPQRRKRVYLLAIQGAGNWRTAAEILFEPEGLRGDFEASRKAGEETAFDAGSSVEAGGLQRTVGTLCADTHPGAYTGQDAYTGRLIPAIKSEDTLQPLSHWEGGDIHPTLNQSAKGSGGVGASNQELFSQGGAYLVPGQPIPIQDGREMEKKQNGMGIAQEGDPAYTIDTTGAQAAAIPFRKSKRACSVTDNETWVLADAANTLNNFDLGDTRTTHAVVQPIVYENHPNDSRITGPLDVAPTVVSRFGTGGGNVPLVNNEPIGFAMREDATNGTFDVKQVDTSLCLQALRPAVTSHHAQNIIVHHQMPGSVAPTVTSSGPPYSRTGNERVEAEALAITFQPGNLRRDAGADPSTTTTTTTKASAGDQMPHIATAMAVRRLTPEECEKLQGFKSGWSKIPWKGKPEEDCPDGPRYKACGNSMAVPCMFWIGNRIAQHEAKA